MTSVSVSDENSWPRSSSVCRSAVAFSMIPLCTTAISPLQHMCGCALPSVGAPCVAQRVCAIPIDPWIGFAVTTFSSLEILPATLRVSTPLPFMIATPAES